MTDSDPGAASPAMRPQLPDAQAHAGERDDPRWSDAVFLVRGLGLILIGGVVFLLALAERWSVTLGIGWTVVAAVAALGVALAGRAPAVVSRLRLWSWLPPPP